MQSRLGCCRCIWTVFASDSECSLVTTRPPMGLHRSHGRKRTESLPGKHKSWKKRQSVCVCVCVMTISHQLTYFLFISPWSDLLPRREAREAASPGLLPGALQHFISNAHTYLVLLCRQVDDHMSTRQLMTWDFGSSPSLGGAVEGCGTSSVAGLKMENPARSAGLFFFCFVFFTSKRLQTHT